MQFYSTNDKDLRVDLKEAVIEEAQQIYHHVDALGAGGDDWYDHDKAAEQKATGHGLSPALERASAVFDLLRGLASGPNLENQLSVAATDILSCVNRIMSYCEYTSVSDVDYAGADNEAAKGQLLSQVSYVLLALLEGVPEGEGHPEAHLAV